MSTSMKIAVVGATGRVGRHVVDVLTERGHDVVPISRTHGVDVITGEGLATALAGVESIVDAATGPSPEQQAATDFFTTAATNLQEAGQRAGVRRIVVVSIINTERLKGGYSVAKVAHEQAILSGPIPARVLRAAQFHEFVGQLVQWGTRGDVTYVPEMRTQLVAAARSPRHSPSWPSPRPRRPDRRSRSPVRARRASSRWRSCSSADAATRCESRPSATRSTARRASPGSSCPAHWRCSAARPSRSGWTRAAAEFDTLDQGESRGGQSRPHRHPDRIEGSGEDQYRGPSQRGVQRAGLADRRRPRPRPLLPRGEGGRSASPTSVRAPVPDHHRLGRRRRLRSP